MTTESKPQKVQSDVETVQAALTPWLDLDGRRNAIAAFGRLVEQLEAYRAALKEIATCANVSTCSLAELARDTLASSPAKRPNE